MTMDAANHRCTVYVHQVRKSGIYSQCTYLTIGWRRREREDVSVLLEESGGCVISTLQETNPEKIYDGTRKLKPKI